MAKKKAAAKKKAVKKSAMGVVVIADNMVVAQYLDMKACDTDLGNPDFLVSRPDLDGQRVQIAVIDKETVICDQQVQKALEALTANGFDSQTARALLGLDEPSVPKTAEIPGDWQQAGVKDLRAYAKIACPSEKTGRWTVEACRMRIRKYLEAQKPPVTKEPPNPKQLEKDLAEKLPTSGAPMPPPAPPAIPAPPIPPGFTFPPPAVKPPQSKTNSIPAPPPPPPIE